ncbi:MAG TPA: protein kinase [Polyangia bacterium]|nr:protein kinase [Polyangia bacterium]
MFDVGDEIGPYKIVRRLGAGGMGEVFQGRHRHMHRDAAIKILRQELSSNAEVVRRFFTEARATAAVRHPAIIEVFDCNVHPRGSAYIVMELLEGEDLAKRLERGPLAGDLPSLRDVSRQVAGGLGAAHDAGIVHRDLKPGNVFLPSVGGVKILDFGIAKLLAGDAQGHERTRTGNVLGTPLYMSPEQARGAREVDHRADVYALGCLMFEMLAGRPPFVDRAAAEVIVAHIFKPAPRVSSLVANVPPALDALVAAMLEKEPSARPQSMKDVVAKLDAAIPVATPGAPRVATQLLGSGKAVTPAPVPAPTAKAPMVATPAVTTPVAPPSAAATKPVATPSGGRDARQFTRAGTTTLGSSASEISTTSAEDGDFVAPSRPKWLVPAIGGGAVALVALVLVLEGGSGSRAAPAVVAAAPAPTEAAPPPKAPAAEPAEVSIAVSSEPAGAELWVGQETTPRGRTPLELRLDRGEPPLRAQLRAPGHAPADVTLDPRAPAPVSVALTPVAAPSSASHHAHGKKEAKAEGGGFKAIED